MNINQLHDKLVKKANILKIAGHGATKLRNIIADFNKVRDDKNLIDSLKQIGRPDPDTLMPASDILRKSLAPFILKNRFNSTQNILNTFRSPYALINDDLNKLIDRINDNIISRKKRIRSLEGSDAAKAFDQKLVNKYIKDIPSK